MGDRKSLGRLSREPLYNTRAVVQMSGVPADTVRAWERRYGLPRPFRTSANQRLYSEMDVGVIVWLRDRTNEGMTISQAIQRLKLESPEVFPADRQPQPATQDGVSNSGLRRRELRNRLVDAAIAFDTRAADRAIDESLAFFSIEEFCAHVVTPALQEIGDCWSRQEISVASEHFMTRLLSRRLASIFALVSPLDGRGTVVGACPDGEDHDVGLLVLSIILSRRGWRVVYLGASVPTVDLVASVRVVRPDLVCLSATSEVAVEDAVEVSKTLDAVFDRAPPIAIGGSAVSARHRQRRDSNAEFLIGTANDVVEQIVRMIEHR